MYGRTNSNGEKKKKEDNVLMLQMSPNTNQFNASNLENIFILCIFLGSADIREVISHLVIVSAIKYETD